MRISKYIHSCLLVESGADRILFDPGKFSFIEGLVKPDDFRNLSAIILTHQHPDHVDDDALKKILVNNSSAVVITNTEIQAHLAKEQITAEVHEDGVRQIGNITIKAVAAAHAKLLNAEPPRNTAYVVDETLLHPGDSFDYSLDAYQGIQILALPIMAPWTTELAVAEFARRIAPQQIIPIHDGYAKDFFLEQRYDNFEKYFSKHGSKFLRLSKPGDSLET